MQIQDRLLAVVLSRSFRTGLALTTALVWFGFVVAGEAGRNWGLAVVYGVPAVLVLVWWRTRPWIGIGLAVLTVLLVLFAAASGTSVNAGGVVACMTAWFAILGASLSGDRWLPRAGAALVAFDALLSFVFNGLPSFVIVALTGAVALGSGWGWRQVRQTEVLEGRLTETSVQAKAAERDVIIEQERNRVARDVHDVVAHSLAVVIAQADGARYAAEKDPTTVGPALDAIAETARVALGEVRTLLHELRHTQSATPAPGSGDVDALVDGFRALGLTVEVSHFGHQRALGEATQLAVYRVLQESLTNALRHGDTTQPVDVDFDWGDHALAIVVTSALLDDGVPQIDGPGHGIPGMRERAALAGGDFTVGIGTRGMFRVRASLPASPAPDATTAVLPRG